MDEDDSFVDRVADRLAALPTVSAVMLGGSRALGTQRPDSDWDLAIYCRGRFDPQTLRDIGWPGEVSEIGAWGGGAFELVFRYARVNHAPYGRLTQCVGLLAQAASQTAQPVPDDLHHALARTHALCQAAVLAATGRK